MFEAISRGALKGAETGGYIIGVLAVAGVFLLIIAFFICIILAVAGEDAREGVRDDDHAEAARRVGRAAHVGPCGHKRTGDDA